MTIRYTGIEDGVFLGNYEQFDLYWYDQGEFEPTLVARYGNDGPEYYSGLCFGWTPDAETSPLVVARKLAQARGLDVRAEQYEGKMIRISPNMIAHQDSDYHDLLRLSETTSNTSG